MKPYRHRILLCLDRSPFSEGCVAYAIWLAKTFDSDITLVHVMQPRGASNGPQTVDALAWEVARQEALAYLDPIAKTIGQALGRSVDVKLEQGRPSERIVDLARDLAADFTVLGSRGEGDPAAWSLGSTAQHVLAVTRSSVFIAHPSKTTPTDATPTRILVPLDGSVRAESVLPAAARIARARNAEVLLVHVVQEPLPSALLRAVEDMVLAHALADRLEKRANEYLATLREQMARELPHVSAVVARHVNEHRALLDLSQREGTDLIVLSAHGSTCDPSRSFGSVTAYLLAYSNVSLLVLQDLAESESRVVVNAMDAAPVTTKLRASYAPGSV